MADRGTTYKLTCRPGSYGPPEGAPREVKRDVVKVRGLKVEIVHLDDGRRIIPPDSYKNFATVIRSRKLTDTERDKLARIVMIAQGRLRGLGAPDVSD